MIFTDEFLNQLGADAEQEINQDLAAIYWKFYLPIVTGTSGYTVPPFVRSIQRITYRGRKLEPVSLEELQALTPATVFVSKENPAFNIETSQSRPWWYAMHPTNVYDIRFYPSPAETLGIGPDPYSQEVNEPYVCVSCWRASDSTLTDPKACLPSYIDRRTRKAYILARAFGAEGPGQNLKASAYYKQKYDFLISSFRAINEGAYIGKKYAVEDGELSVDNFRYPKPILPANFERVRYR